MIGEPIQIRRAVVLDVPKIAEAEKSYIDCPWTEEQIAAELTKDNALFFVATYNGGFAGYVSAVCAAGECEIANIAVERVFRRKGVASKLLTSLISEAKAVGATSVFLLVSDSNIGARKLYEKIGFTEIGRRKSYYGASDAVSMRLNV